MGVGTMRRTIWLATAAVTVSAVAALLTSAVHAQPAPAPAIPRPAAITADGMPPLPDSLRVATQPYLEYRTASVLGWNPATRGLLISTRFGNAAQLHEVARAGADRRQISFEAEPIVDASYAPVAGAPLLVRKDVGGGEFFQLYSLTAGQLTLLTDGKSRNEGGTWSRDGKLVGFTSTRRDGTAGDLYVIDPRAPGTARMVHQVAENGWNFDDFAPGNAKALVTRGISAEKSEVFELDLASGALTRLTPEGAATAWSEPRYAPDGSIYVIADVGSDFARLGTLARGGGFKPVSPETKWDVETYRIADDGSFIAYVVNEDGASKLRRLDRKTGQVRTLALPTGVIGGLEIAPWGDIAVSLDGARSPADAWVVDGKTGKATRWTTSETGGLDPAQNREPELVRVESFDGLEVSGLLYRPDPARFPGKRPLIFSIHGGPEGQSRPGFQGRNNYYLNALGVALFYPNVRGSTGYGKRFLGLDNGPFKREDSVKDIGAFLDALAADPLIDPARIAEAGGSYGGYMCYASAIRYAGRFKAAQCTVAISNFVTFLENTQSYRRDLRRVEYGDERVPEQRAKLLAISPLTDIAKIKVPLMVVTGGNDPRVPPSEADQVVKAVRGNGGTVWHMLAADEGHGYRKKANTDYNFWGVLAFWQAYLLGDGK